MLSVVIPTRNRRERLLRLLGALGSQDIGADRFEVVVVADGCTDDTVRAVEAARTPYALCVVEQPLGGQGAARNRGAAECAGEMLLFLDDDTVLPPDFVRRMCSVLDDGADIVMPVIRVGEWVPDVLLAREQREWAEYGALVAGVERPGVEDVHFVATGVRRGAFEAAGGFDASFTAGGAWGREDAELGYRLLLAGVRVECRRDLVVTTEIVTEPAVTLQRGRELGRNDVRFVRKHPEVAAQIFGAALRKSRIRRAVGALVRLSPAVTVLLWPLRRAVIAAIRRGWTGGFLYRLYLVVWSAEWWLGVLDAGGGALARGASRHQ